MSYGRPSIANGIDALLSAGVKRIVTLPLYPQYSSTTTAAVFDAVEADLAGRSTAIVHNFINDYHNAPNYIAALANSVNEFWKTNGRGEKLLLSFHGVPISTLAGGDPYDEQCKNTARLLAAALELEASEWLITYQSRVGREEWLAPATDESIKQLGKDGVRQLDVVCPGFSTDCLETLEEIAMQNAEFFLESSGESLRYIPALNARDDHVQLFASLIQQLGQESAPLAAAS
jgi:ferrochelatase